MQTTTVKSEFGQDHRQKTANCGSKDATQKFPAPTGKPSGHQGKAPRDETRSRGEKRSQQQSSSKYEKKYTALKQDKQKTLGQLDGLKEKVKELQENINELRTPGSLASVKNKADYKKDKDLAKSHLNTRVAPELGARCMKMIAKGRMGRVYREQKPGCKLDSIVIGNVKTSYKPEGVRYGVEFYNKMNAFAALLMQIGLLCNELYADFEYGHNYKFHVYIIPSFYNIMHAPKPGFLVAFLFSLQYFMCFGYYMFMSYLIWGLYKRAVKKPLKEDSIVPPWVGIVSSLKSCRLVAVRVNEYFKDSADVRPEFDRSQRKQKSKAAVHHVLVELRTADGYRYYKDWGNKQDVPARFWKESDRVPDGGGRTLKKVLINVGLLATALNRKTMLASRADPALTLDACIRLMQANPHYQEQQEWLMSGSSLYRDMALIAGPIVTRDLYYSNEYF